MIVVLENTAYERALRAPFLKQLSERGALLTHYEAVASPSQPNYLALTSGTTFGYYSDHSVDFPAKSIADLLDAKNLTWKTYAEGYPGRCFLGPRSGKYVRKHLPFLSYLPISKNPLRCAKIVNASELDQDLKNDQLPNYSLYIPDLDNDGHDTGVEYADRWLETTFGARLKDPAFIKDLLFVVTFDEGSSLLDHHTYAVLLGAEISPGTEITRPYNHYSLLRTIEEEFQLGTLGRHDQSAQPITEAWNKPNQILSPGDAALSSPLIRARAVRGVHSIPYTVVLPPQYTREKSWPVILYLHGSGESGSNNEAQLKVGILPWAQTHPERYPAILVLPQSPSEDDWEVPLSNPGEPKVTSLDLAEIALDEVTSEFNGDPSRIYLTGISMGGYGAYELASARPGKFAAVLPISGGGNPQLMAPLLRATPIWDFHGRFDPVVPVSASREMISAIRAAGNTELRYTEYFFGLHNVWDRTYGDAKVTDWLFAQKKPRF